MPSPTLPGRCSVWARGSSRWRRPPRLVPEARLSAVPESVLTGSVEAFSHWIDWASDSLHLEVEEVEAGVADLGALLKVAYPAIVRVRTTREPVFVLVIARRGARLTVLAPDLRRRTLAVLRWNSTLRPPTPRRFTTNSTGCSMPLQ